MVVDQILVFEFIVWIQVDTRLRDTSIFVRYFIEPLEAKELRQSAQSPSVQARNRATSFYFFNQVLIGRFFLSKPVTLQLHCLTSTV